jgi:Carboxypeptidase regulatory-like domain
MNRKLFLLLLSALCLSWPIGAVGQVLKGSISGTVVDPQGAVVANSQVKATHVTTGTVLNTKSDGAGLFRLNLIPTGTYTVEISGQGFKTSMQKDIAVTAGSDTGLGNVQLAVGGSETTVEVSGAAPLVETTQAQVTNTFSGTVLANFAGIQENQGLDNLALFVPGIVSVRDQNFANTNGGTGFSVNGIRGRNNDQEIDGQNNNDNSVAGPALLVADPEFVQQYVLITNNFGPEYGRNAGSVVNIITKSGTNGWHGSIYANENNSILNSMTSTEVGNGLTQPPRANDEFGGFTIGGPFVKNKAFFFGGFDQEILSTGTVYGSNGAITPTPAGLATLAGCFPTGDPANAIAAMAKFGAWGISAGNPQALNVTTQTVGGCPGVQVGGVQRVLPTPSHDFNFVTREDVNIGAHDTLMGRYIFNRNNNFNQNDNGAAGYVFNIPALSQAVLLSETHNFTSRMVNELRVGFDRLNVEFGGNSFGTEPTTGGINTAVTDVIMSSATPTLGFGVNASLPQGRVVNTWQAQDNWNYVLGKHSVKAGVNWTYQQSPNIFLPFINGAYVFFDGTLGPGTTALDAYVNNAPIEGIITQGNPELPLKEYDTFFYVGDDWKISRNLTLNLGVTYSYAGQPLNLLHTLGVQQQAGPNALWDPTLPSSVTAPVQENAYKKAVGPSFGFAYNPQWGGFITGHGKTTIRGGYRVSYDPSFYNIILNNYGGAPSVLSAAVAAPPLPAVPTAPNVRPLLLSSLAPTIGHLDPRDLTEVTTSPNFRPDQVQSWAIGFEREVTRNSAFEARFVGNHASQLFQTVDGNPFLGTASDPGLAQLFPNLVPAGDTPCPTSQAYGAAAVGRVNCNAGILLSRNNSGYSNYAAIQTEFRANNMFKQLTARIGYTYSKTLDNVSEIFATGGAGTTTSIAQNPFNTSGAEYSFSGLDIPQQLSLTLVEELPFFNGQHGVLGHVLGGWVLSGAYVYESGQRFTPITQNLTSPTIAGDFFDSGFLGAFGSGQTVARPFFGNPSAPANTVGIFAGDACTAVPGGAAACALAPNTLISLNALNATGAANTVTNSQVRYIANTGIAEGVFGTPYGNVPRNAGIDAPLNYLNLSVDKRVKLNERASFEFRFSALNALNHANFATVVPTIDTAGNPNFGAGFGLPNLTDDKIPGSNLAASRRLYVGGIFRF